GGVIDGDGPIVAGHVPVELVVLIEKARAVAHAVGDLNRARSIDRVGNVYLQIAVGAGSRRIVFELAAAFVGDAGDVHEELVVRAVRSGIFDRDLAVNAMPLAHKCQSDRFIDQGAAILVDGDGVLEARNAPGFCEQRRGETKDNREEQQRGRWKRQFALRPDHGIRTSRQPARGRRRWSRRTGAPGSRTCWQGCWLEKPGSSCSGRAPPRCNSGASSGSSLRSGSTIPAVE